MGASAESLPGQEADDQPAKALQEEEQEADLGDAFDDAPLPRVRGRRSAHATNLFDAVHLAEIRLLAGHPSLDELEEDHGLRLVHLQKYRGMDVDADQDHARVVRRPVARIALLAEPHPPVGRVELADLRAIAADRREARDRYPLARPILVVGEVDVRVGFDVAELGGVFSRDEPEVRARGPLLGRHRARLEMAVGPPGGHHRDLDVVDLRVQLVLRRIHPTPPRLNDRAKYPATGLGGPPSASHRAPTEVASPPPRPASRLPYATNPAVRLSHPKRAIARKPHRRRLMRRTAFVFLIPLLLPPGPASLRAQESDDDAQWLAQCERDDYGGDDETFCEVVVESVDAPAATIAFDGGRNGGVLFKGWEEERMEVHARIQAHADSEDRKSTRLNSSHG